MNTARTSVYWLRVLLSRDHCARAHHHDCARQRGYTARAAMKLNEKKSERRHVYLYLLSLFETIQCVVTLCLL